MVQQLTGVFSEDANDIVKLGVSQEYYQQHQLQMMVQTLTVGDEATISGGVQVWCFQVGDISGAGVDEVIVNDYRFSRG